ncbi:CerR family C-terminal domain-containing protein [Dyella jejuensis]|uniref:CerR family C-terminal domain-containing protein n=1 Tax=Dyella jejuensis TaxID=1432009 RepID=A0ABW8JN12_9GAMM
MSQTKRPRRPSAGGYARGDETRQRIIAAALELFGEHGFAGASTRDIAAAAGVNAPALQYYFQSKEGLYQACAEYITHELKARFAPAMRYASAALKKADSDTETLIEAFIGIQAAMVDSMLTPSHASKGQLIGRELAGEAPDVASKLLRKHLRQPLNRVTLGLLARISGLAPDDPVTRIRLLTLKGQILSFHYPPGACLEVLGWREIDATKGALIKDVILAQTRTLLHSWVAVPAAGGGRKLQSATRSV